MAKGLSCTPCVRLLLLQVLLQQLGVLDYDVHGCISVADAAELTVGTGKSPFPTSSSTEADAEVLHMLQNGKWAGFTLRCWRLVRHTPGGGVGSSTRAPTASRLGLGPYLVSQRTFLDPDITTGAERATRKYFDVGRLPSP